MSSTDCADPADDRDVTFEDGPYGGDGGQAWTDGGEVHLKGPITGIEIHAGDRIDGIRVRYGETWADLHGSSTGGDPYLAEMGGAQPGIAGDPMLIDIVNRKKNIYFKVSGAYKEQCSQILLSFP